MGQELVTVLISFGQRRRQLKLILTWLHPIAEDWKVAGPESGSITQVKRITLF